jgi:hypothetical protein
MLRYLAIISPAIAAILSSRAIPDNTIATGSNPIVVASSTFLGNLTADNSCSHRDLGFTGSINNVWYHIWGDTLACDPGVTDPSKDPHKNTEYQVRDAISQSTSNPLKVHDLHLDNFKPVPRQLQFLPFDKSFGENVNTGFGGTSLCETNATAGEAAFFYLVVRINLAPDYHGLVDWHSVLKAPAEKGVPIKGAGVARVSTAFGTPTVEKRFGNQGIWWNSTKYPRYGDQAAYRDTQGPYIYAWGGAPISITGDGSNNVYQTRVLATQAFDLTKYQYWHGRATGWNSTPLTTFNSETAVMAGTGQGQVVYNNYYKTYFFIHTCKYLPHLPFDRIHWHHFADIEAILIRTAPNPEGPWTNDVQVWTAKSVGAGYTYAGVAHPYFDTTGKTLIVSYTNSPNVNEVVKVNFKWSMHCLFYWQEGGHPWFCIKVGHFPRHIR